MASYNEHIEVMSIMLKNGADIKAKTARGCTPLHRAALNGQSSINYRFAN